MAWIKIHNKLLEWEWASCPETMALWIHILLRANFEDRRWHGIVIPRGSLVTGRKELAKNTGLSEQQVRTSLNRLISTNEITISSTNKFTIVTICKYDDYQIVGNGINQENNQDSNQRATNNQPTNNQQSTTTIDIKNTRNKESISSDIDKKVSEIAFDAIPSTCQKKQNLDISFVKDELQPVFLRFLDMRKKTGKPLKTPKGIADRYNTLIKLSGDDTDLAIKIAEQTISHEWQDFYELKNNTSNGNDKQHNVSNPCRSGTDFSDRHYESTLPDWD